MVGRSNLPAGYRRALITGATSGIGAAFAEGMARETALVLTGRRQERLDAAAARLARDGREVETIAADLSTPEGCRSVAERALGDGIDLLICNAGVGFAGRFADTPLALQSATIAVNVTATAQLLHLLLPDMIARARQAKRRCGVIILSSTAAFGPRPGMGCYAATKAFGLMLGEALATELRREPIDILVLCPTHTATEFFDQAGLPPPEAAMSAAQVAREGMAALGRRAIHLCGRKHQWLHRLLAFNPALASLVQPWRSRRPRLSAAGLIAAPQELGARRG
ncbi:MAG TPA: SDR family NAD(P)-dependent oxidoreductase [Stellaceae bacterium]|nr:SDR family NAD(P)-dependent oxidoreductase [Stellaceae bacterium]